jgi:putative ABC transport system permease protein
MKFPWTRKQRQDQLNEELATHLQMSTQARIDRGESPAQATQAACREFGNIALIHIVTRDQWAYTWLDNLLPDFRYAARTLRKNPGFTAVAILTLALGIGANTAIFSVVDGVLLRSLPFSNPSQLVDISARSTLFDFTNLGLSLADIADVRTAATSFSIFSPYLSVSKELAGDAKPERVEGADITEDFFPALGIAPLIGRAFTSADMQPGGRAVLISYHLWHERFGGDTAAIGKSIMLDGQPHTIVGVMPALPHMDFASDNEIWTPFLPSEEERSSRQNHDFAVLARLKPGRTVEQAQQELDTIAGRLAYTYPEADKGWTIHATSLKAYLLGDARGPLLILFCAVGFVLLIACANVSNLFLSRGWGRRREFAIRSALGATRGALLRQLFVETALVALAGGLCALLVAAWTMHALSALLPPETPRIQEVGISSSVAWFTLAASLLAAILSGLAPALLSSRQALAAIKGSGAGSSSSWSGAGHNFLRRLLAVREVAVAAILLIGATLAVQSFARLVRADLGFHPDHIVTMRIEFPEFRFAQPEQGIAFVQQILNSSRAIPDVEAASAGLDFPLGDAVGETTFQTELSAKDPQAGEQSALGNSVTPGFFSTFGIPLLAGRDFNNGDARGKSKVFIVNEALARKYFGTVDVVGKRFSTRKENGHPVWGEIIGVAGNVREIRPSAEPKVQIYAPFAQARLVTGIFLAIRTKADPLAIVPAIQDRVWGIDKNRPIAVIKTVEQQIAEDFATPKSQSILLSVFSALGFILALVGVYGVMSYQVSQQTREIGIRMALGAEPCGILRAVIVHGLKLTLTGVAIGLATSLALTRFIRSLLFGISPTDPLTFASVAISLTLVAVAACCIPARRAMTVDPIIALRHD